MKESYKWCGVPWSCCHTKYHRNRQCGYGMRKDRAKFNLANEIHTIGCLDKGFEFFRNNMGMYCLILGVSCAHLGSVKVKFYSEDRYILFILTDKSNSTNN